MEVRKVNLMWSSHLDFDKMLECMKRTDVFPAIRPWI